MPKFNLNWMYMIIALMLLGLWWGSDSKGAGSKAVTYSEFQDYVKKGYVSKVLGYEDKSIEAFLKPTAVGAVFGADSTKVGRNQQDKREYLNQNCGENIRFGRVVG